MDLILSALLLASFVVGVDVLVDGGADLATRFGGLFRAPDLGWPRGIQEEDAPPTWSRQAPAARQAEPGTEPDPAVAAEIVDGGDAVSSLARVRRR